MAKPSPGAGGGSPSRAHRCPYLKIGILLAGQKVKPPVGLLGRRSSESPRGGDRWWKTGPCGQTGEAQDNRSAGCDWGGKGLRLEAQVETREPLWASLRSLNLGPIPQRTYSQNLAMCLSLSYLPSDGNGSSLHGGNCGWLREGLSIVRKSLTAGSAVPPTPLHPLHPLPVHYREHLLSVMTSFGGVTCLQTNRLGLDDDAVSCRSWIRGRFSGW